MDEKVLICMENPKEYVRVVGLHVGSENSNGSGKKKQISVLFLQLPGMFEIVSN